MKADHSEIQEILQTKAASKGSGIKSASQFLKAALEAKRQKSKTFKLSRIIIAKSSQIII